MPTTTCEECGREFKNFAGLGAHKRRAHGIPGKHAPKKTTQAKRSKGLVHPPLGATMRVTALGEQPGGKILVGLTEKGTGKNWFAIISEVSA